MKNKIKKEIKAKNFSKAIDKAGLRGYQFKDKIIPLSEKETNTNDAYEKDVKSIFYSENVKETLKNIKEELKRKRRITITPDKFDKEIDKTFLKHIGEMK